MKQSEDDGKESLDFSPLHRFAVIAASIFVATMTPVALTMFGVTRGLSFVGDVVVTVVCSFGLGGALFFALGGHKIKFKRRNT